MKKDTLIVNAGRSARWAKGVVNPPVQRASTIVFDSIAQLKQATGKKHQGELFYGRRGTQTHFAFQEAMCELEGAAGCALYPSGSAAISGALLSFVKSGDHILVVDNVYEPTRAFCDNVLARMGVTTSYFDPMLPASELASLFQANTRVLFLEAPGSISMEICDIPGFSAVAKVHNALVFLDNTYSAPLLLKPFELGVDICVTAATKYIVGHSDVMLGIATCQQPHWETLREQSYLMGYCTSPDDIYLAARGLRTLSVRLAQHQASALKVAEFLSQHELVDHVRHPALPSCPGHEFWLRDFHGSNGLFSFVLKTGNQAALTALLDGMHHFKMGYSWGGFESLITGNLSLQSLRSATQWQQPGPIIRLHIGLEDPDDLIAELSLALARFKQALTER